MSGGKIRTIHIEGDAAAEIIFRHGPGDKISAHASITVAIIAYIRIPGKSHECFGGLGRTLSRTVENERGVQDLCRLIKLHFGILDGKVWHHTELYIGGTAGFKGHFLGLRLVERSGLREHLIGGGEKFRIVEASVRLTPKRSVDCIGILV